MIFLAKRPINQNAMKALDQMKTEIANELDAKLTNEEKIDGTMTSDLVRRAERKALDEDKDMFYPFV